MTIQRLKTKANAKLADFWSTLETKQDAYFAKHGKYFQLLISDPVVDGVDTTFILRKPNDEKHLLDVNFEFKSPIPFSISVDEWVGTDGAGYSATATVELPNGKKFSRTRNSEQEDTNWQEVIKDVIE